MDPFVAAMQGRDLASPSPIDRAISAGARAAGIGGAFMGGYQAALRALVPSLPADEVVCLAATEEGGAHPRAIATRLEPAGEGEWRLTGRKRWVTGGTHARRLLVVASTGVDAAGKNRLRVAQVDPRAEGVTIVAQPPTPFAPEIPHAALELAGVRVRAEDLLEGDGYERWLKPFRTVEDLHVHGAVLAHVLGLGWRAGWPDRVLEEGLALLASTRALAREDPSDRATHAALAGLLGLGRALLGRTRELWPSLGADAQQALERDLPLLDVAGTARARRTEVAWRELRGSMVSFG